jgi:hypothetical protein
VKTIISLAGITFLALVGCDGTQPQSLESANVQSAESASSAPSNGALWHSDAGGITPSSGSIGAEVLCQAVLVSIKFDGSAAAAPKLIGRPSTCSKESIYEGYLRGTLFIEGVDAPGRRLFVASTINPRHQDVEAPPPASGGSMGWHSVDTPMTDMTVLIHAPITSALSRLRWYDVDENNQPRAIGDAVWVAPTSAPP